MAIDASLESRGVGGGEHSLSLQERLQAPSGGWQVFKSDFTSKKIWYSLIRKLGITFECDTITISIAPAEEGNNELLVPWHFLETVSASGCYRL